MNPIVEAKHLLDELEQLLMSERRAVAAVDTERVERLGESKRQVLARLADLGDGWRRDRSLVAALTRVRAQAEANSRLLSYAVDTCADLLGLRRTSGTYDARARLSCSVSAFTRRAL